MAKIINSFDEILSDDFYNISIDPYWNSSSEKELQIHKIHAYPAKFPAFITEKSLDYITNIHKKPSKIADIFCGCGTVAYESRRKSIDFWGCDINPVATLIARVKSRTYKSNTLYIYFKKIVTVYENTNTVTPYEMALERIRYWYFENEYYQLARLKYAIDNVVPKKSQYRDFFYCAFSNILKATSRWLTKSIKPQRDPEKNIPPVKDKFIEQCLNMIKAFEKSEIAKNSKVEIKTGNILNTQMQLPKVDMIVTSPPYVTSYEYADLHQLSSLWLEYTDDYRKLRTGTVGSVQFVRNIDYQNCGLNKTGRHVVADLHSKDKSQARAVAKYYLDMQKVVARCNNMLNEGGHAFFIIGDTEYKGIHIENAKHLIETMLNCNFESINITKRKVTGKILTPYRDDKGKFTSDSNNRKVYSEEFIVFGRKIVG